MLPAKYAELGLDRYWSRCKCGEVPEDSEENMNEEDSDESLEEKRAGPEVRSGKSVPHVGWIG